MDEAPQPPYRSTVFAGAIHGRRRLNGLASLTPLLALLIVGFPVTSLLPPLVAPGWAQEVISQEEPQPESVDESQTPIDRLFRLEVERVRPFPWLKEPLKDLPPFLRDTKLTLSPRSFYLYRDKFDGSISEAWAMGGALSYQSGWLFDRLAIGAVGYTSQPAYAPEDRDGTLLLEPKQEGFTALGQSYVRVRLIDENYLNLYRYAYDTPFINRQDSRMTPNTFEGYTIQGTLGGQDDTPGFRYLGGYITKMKARDEDDFTSMSEAAGTTVDRGVGMGGALFTAGLPVGKLSAGVAEYYSTDILNIFYAESKYTLPVTENLGALLAVQYTDQRSVGSNLLTGSSFDVEQIGIKSEVSYKHGVFTVGYTSASEGADLQSPWGGYPGYTSVQVSDFDKAGEDAFLVKLAYEFSRIGAPGLSAYGLVVHGWGRVDPSTHAPIPNENEMNLDLQWRPKASLLKGFSVRARYSHQWQDQATENTQDDIRFIINYDFDLL